MQKGGGGSIHLAAYTVKVRSSSIVVVAVVVIETDKSCPIINKSLQFIHSLLIIF